MAYTPPAADALVLQLGAAGYSPPSADSLVLQPPGAVTPSQPQLPAVNVTVTASVSRTGVVSVNHTPPQAMRTVAVGGVARRVCTLEVSIGSMVSVSGHVVRAAKHVGARPHISPNTSLIELLPASPV